MDSLQRIGDWFAAEYRKNGLKILTGVKYTSMVASPILAAFGAVRAYKEIEKRKKERNVEELPLKETIGIVAKNEAAAGVTVIGGIAASAKIDHDMKETIDALTTAVVLGENKIRELKEAEKEVVGEEKREEIQKKADEKAVQNADIKHLAVDPDNGYYSCVDSMTGQTFITSERDFNRAVMMTNRTCIINGFEVTLSDFLETCGGEGCTLGDNYVWSPANNPNRKEIQIYLRSTKDKYGRPAYLITYGTVPELSGPPF